MTDTDTESLVSDLKKIVYFYLENRTKRRVGRESNASDPEWRKAWESVASDLYYQLRSARTRRRFSECLAQTLWSIPQGKLNKNLGTLAVRMTNKETWEDLRDILMMTLSAVSYQHQSETKE